MQEIRIALPTVIGSEPQLPPTLRLALLLPHATDIAEQANIERVMKAEASIFLHGAVEYVPPLVEEMLQRLRIAKSLLPSKDEKARKMKTITTEDVVDEIHSQPSKISPVNPFPNAEETRIIADNLLHALHPDTSHQAGLRFIAEAETRRLYTRTVGAYERNDPVITRELQWEVLPAYYVTLIQELTRNGKTLEEVVQEYPEIVDQIEILCAKAETEFAWGQRYRRFYRPEPAREKAEELRKRKDIHAEEVACGLLYTTLGDVIEVTRSKGRERDAERLEITRVTLGNAATYCLAAAEYHEYRLMDQYVSGSTDYFRDTNLDAALLQVAPSLFELASAITSPEDQAFTIDTSIESVKKTVMHALEQAKEYATILNRNVPRSSIRRPPYSELQTRIVRFQFGLDENNGPEKSAKE